MWNVIYIEDRGIKNTEQNLYGILCYGETESKVCRIYIWEIYSYSNDTLNTLAGSQILRKRYELCVHRMQAITAATIIQYAVTMNISRLR